MVNIILGAIALGLIWAIATIGVFTTYRVLDIADLSVEGTIVLGAATSAVIIYNGGNPVFATFAATVTGALGGLLTGLLHTKLKIPALLSGILTMTAMYSINIRVMLGSANISLLRKDTVFSPLINMGINKNVSTIIICLLCVLFVIAIFYWFFGTEMGSGIRATGNNLEMAAAQGINTNNAKLIGLAISNGLVGLAGGLLSQYLGFSDSQMGVGAIVVGLASVIIGEVLFGTKTFFRTLFSLVLGAVAYRIFIAFVFEAGMPATDLKLFTAVTVAIALYLPYIKSKIDSGQEKRKGMDENAKS